jgi:phosphatidylinositol glycan class U
MKIAESGESVSTRLFTSPRKDKRWSSQHVAAFFLFNPFTIATCLARPTSVFTTTSILYAVSKAVSGQTISAIFALAFAGYLSLSPLLLLPPLILLCYDRRRPSQEKISVIAFSLKAVTAATLSSGGLLYMSRVLTGSWQYLHSTYGTHLLLPDLTPNVGLWWYFFIEMFDSFRSFFLGVFWLHLFSYCGGLTIRVRRQPLFVITVLCGLLAIFKPYPSIADASLFLGMLPLYRHVVPLMRYTFMAASAISYATVLGPAFYYLWIYAGSGNANFFYAITLVWSLGLSVLVADLLFAVLRDEWEVERPEMRGREVKQI